MKEYQERVVTEISTVGELLNYLKKFDRDCKIECAGMDKKGASDCGELLAVAHEGLCSDHDDYLLLFHEMY